MFLECHPKLVMKIQEVFWGRDIMGNVSDPTTCTNGFADPVRWNETSCALTNPFIIDGVSRTCNGNTTCKLWPNNGWFGGDPCKGTTKIARITYSCWYPRDVTPGAFYIPAPLNVTTYWGFTQTDPSLDPRFNNVTMRQIAQGYVINTQQDDLATVLRWDANRDRGQYLVYWGPADMSQDPPVFLGTPNIVATPRRILQIQPLTPGVQYMAQVRAVAGSGNVSDFSDPVLFASDSTRVDTLRETMTGFFDDFNTAAGGPNEIKWRQHFVWCDEPIYNAVFINSQFHVHNLVKSWDLVTGRFGGGSRVCQFNRVSVIARPNAIFDFTDREGTIVFDFDGGPGINYWFLDMIEPGTGDVIATLHQAGGKIMYFYGTNRENSGVLQTEFCNHDLCLVPNVRRHFEVKISKNTFALTVDGKLLLSNNIGPGGVWVPEGVTPIPRERMMLFFRQTTTDTLTRQNLPFLTVHWDNFGFDGPAQPIETHAYKLSSSSQFTLVGLGPRWQQVNNTMIVDIPDDLTGVIAARFHYGFSGSTPDVKRSALFINDQKVNIYTPSSTIDGLGVIANIPLGVLRTGQNTIRWYLPRQIMRAGNMRIEVDFDATQPVPSYTQPTPWFDLHAENGFHPAGWYKVGLQARVDSVGPYGAWPQGNGGPPFLLAPLDSPQGANLEYNSTYTITCSIQCNIQMMALGKCTPAKNATLVAKNVNTEEVVVMRSWDFREPHGLTSVGLKVDFNPEKDWGQASWGNTYELFFQVTDTAGTPSIPDYFVGNMSTGSYFPMYIYVVQPDAPAPAPELNNPGMGTVVESDIVDIVASNGSNIILTASSSVAPTSTESAVATTSILTGPALVQAKQSLDFLDVDKKIPEVRRRETVAFGHIEYVVPHYVEPDVDALDDNGKPVHFSKRVLLHPHSRSPYINPNSLSGSFAIEMLESDEDQIALTTSHRRHVGESGIEFGGAAHYSKEEVEAVVVRKGKLELEGMF
jgi:hypothetical protein